MDSSSALEFDRELECPCCRDGGRRDEDGVTVSVREMELYDDEDWEGLIALRKRILDRHEEDPYCFLRLAEVYALAGRHQESLETAARGHALDPEDPWLQDGVLHALFALGRDENDFDWRCETPAVLRLDEELMQRIERRLGRDDRGLEDHPGVVDVGMIYHQLQDEAYLAFGPEELLTAVWEDERFLVDGEPDNPWESYIITGTDGDLSGKRPPSA